MPDIPQKALQAAALALAAFYAGKDGEPLLTAASFEGEAHAALKAAAPILAEQAHANSHASWQVGEHADSVRELIADTLHDMLCEAPKKTGHLEQAEAVLDALAGAGLVVASACACGQPIGTCHSCGQPRCWHCNPGPGKQYEPMKCGSRHEPARAALPERTENA